MNPRRTHVRPEQLTALALGAIEPTSAEDQEALVHVAECDVCARDLAARTTELDALRLEAEHEADAQFDEARLEHQRTRVLARLAHLGQSARVLPFPKVAVHRPVRTGVSNRRWISVAAAAGLLIGIVTGQLLHVLPFERTRAEVVAPTRVMARSTPQVVVPAAVTFQSSDENLIGEIDLAVQRRRAPELVALDALTPSASETR